MLVRLLPLAGLVLLLASCGGTAAPASSGPAGPSSASAAAPPSASSAAASAKPAPASAAQLQKLRVGGSGIATEVAKMIAEDRGYFTQEGVQIEDVPLTGNSSDTIPMLAGAQLDIAGGAPSASLFNSVNRSVGLKIVVPMIVADKNDRSAAMIVRKDLVDGGGYKGPQDLKGKKIGVVGLGSFSQYAVQQLLAKANLTGNDVTWVPLSFPELVTGLANKGIDAAWEVEPFITAAEDKGVAKMVADIGDVLPGFPEGVEMASPSILKDHPDAVQRFVTAIIRAERDYHKAIDLNQGGRDQVVQTLIAHTAIKDPKQYERIGLGPVDPNGTFDLKVLDGLQDFFIQAGALQQKADIGKLVDQSFVDTAVQRLGKA